MRPGAGIEDFGRAVAREQTLVIGGDGVGLFPLGQQSGEFRPLLGPELARAAAIEPIQLGLRGQKHAAQHQTADPVRMRLRIDQRQRRAPTATKGDPFVDPEQCAQPFDIGHQMPGRVILNRGRGPRPSAAALIEQNHPIHLRIEIPPHRRAATATGAAMQDDHRNPIGIAALLHIDTMPIAHIDHPLIERFDRRVQILNCALLVRVLVHYGPI